MKNMGMRRWEFDDYEKILEIVEYIIDFANKKNFQVIIKFHPSGGRHIFEYFKKYKIFKMKKTLLLINYNTNKLLEDNEIFVCLQESSVINQIISMDKSLIFPLMHLNKNYKNNYLFKKIKQDLLVPKKLTDIGKFIDQIKRNSIPKKNKRSSFKTFFGIKSIDMINHYVTKKKY